MELLDYIRTYLVAQNIVRLPTVAGAKPPMWIEPKNGTPAPGEGKNATEKSNVVVGAFYDTGIVPGRLESFMQTDAVTFWFRSKRTPDILDIERQLRAALHDKRGWNMGSLYLIESLQFTALQPVVRDEQAMTFNTQYWFTSYVSDLS
jgi:hypothetical protein